MKIKEIYENVMVSLLWCLCFLVGIMPRFIRYGVISPFAAFILRWVVRYRYKVIVQQLRDSFPEKSEAEISKICNRYYLHLAEMIIGTLSLAAMGNRQRKWATKFNLTEDFHEVIEGKNVIVLTSHYGFWEIALNLYLCTPNHHLMVAYRSLKSSITDKLYKRLRNNADVDVVASQNFMRHYIANRKGINGKNIIVGLIADQNCPPIKGCCWHDFLHHDSLFFDGGEQLAMKFGLPVFYLELERVKAGVYRHNYTQIYDGKEEVQPHEITERYVRCLENTIKAKPEHWMWSHRRWKYWPDENSKFYDNYKNKE